MNILKKNRISKKGLIILFIALFITCFFGMFSTIYADDVDNEEEISQNDINEVSANVSDEPVLNSRKCVVYDRISKTIIYGKNENVKSAMASTTKIMTAIVVLENTDLNQEVVVSKKAGGTGGSRLGLRAGDKVRIEDLLYGLMLRSGNDAAVALAEHVGGSVQGFAELMNNKAVALGLKCTHFVTPHGLDDSNHYTTALELAKLSDYAMCNEKFAKIVGTKITTITVNGMPRQIANTNELLGVLNGVVGIKTGFTNNAGRCLVTETKRNGLDIITVVLGADTKKFRTQDSVKLIEYTCAKYKMKNIEEKIQEEFENWKNINAGRISIKKAKQNEKLNLIIKEINIKQLPLKEGQIEKIQYQINCLTQFDAPVENNIKIGTILVKIDEKIIESIDIVNTEKIEKKTWQDYLREMLFYYKKLPQKIIQNLN